MHEALLLQPLLGLGRLLVRLLIGYRLQRLEQWNTALESGATHSPVAAPPRPPPVASRGAWRGGAERGGVGPGIMVGWASGGHNRQTQNRSLL